MKEIITTFDFTICEKASKEGLKALAAFCRNTFILKEENETFTNEVTKNMEQQQTKIYELTELVV